MKKRLMIIDGNNIFISAYCSNGSISSYGNPIGGVVGFLRSLNKQIRMIKPDQVIICWDGPGGSTKRKLIDKSYKDGRKPIALSKTFGIELSEQDELANRIWQQAKLIEYLNLIPIMQIAIHSTEADDVISYVAKHNYFFEWDKIIVSNDKDFLQLCDKDILVFRPMKEEVYNHNSILKEYSIDVSNFCLARSIVGDISDHLPGVKGIGLTTVAKRFSLLKETKDLTIDRIVEYAQEQVDKKTKIKAYNAVAESRELIRKNYSIMQLSCPMISVQDCQRIDNALNSFDPFWNQSEFTLNLLKDGLASLDWGDLRTWSNRIVSTSKTALKN